MAAFPTTVATDSDLYIAVNATSTQLTDNPLTSGATTVNVISTTAFPTVGFISIDNEIIKYTGKTGTSFTGCTRGADGTSATSHVQNSQVFHNVIAAHHNSLKDDLIAVEQNISDRFGLSSTVILAPTGSAGAPTYAFSAAPTTGIYLTGTGSVRFSSLGTNVFRTHAGGAEVVSGIFGAPNGSASLPSFAFTNDSTSGLFLQAVGNASIAAGGSELMRFSQTNALISVLGARDLAIPSARLFYLDGGGDTFIREQSANVIEMVAGNNAVFRAASTAVIITSAADLQLQAAKRLYLDGGGDTYIHEATANRIELVTGGNVRFRLDDSGFLNILATDVYIASTKKLFLDGGSDTYVFESSANEIRIVTGGNDRYRFTDGTFNLQANIVPVLNITYNLGSASLRWQGLYVQDLFGTTTNDNATAGAVGEEVRSSISTATNFPATGTYGDLTSISLTAGDWDLDGVLRTTLNGATMTGWTMGISTTSGNSTTGLVEGDNLLSLLPPNASTGASGSIPTWRLKLSATTTVYLKYKADFSAGTPQAFGRISARRRR